MTRIAIDPNVRVHGNLTYSGFEDIDGELPLDGCVEVFEPDGDLVGTARVVDIDEQARLVYLEVEWGSLRPRVAPAGTTVRLLGVQGWVSVLDSDMHNLAFAGSAITRTIPTRPDLATAASSPDPQVGGSNRVLTHG